MRIGFAENSCIFFLTFLFSVLTLLLNLLNIKYLLSYHKRVRLKF